MPLRRTGEVDLQKYGFIFIDFKNQEKNKHIQELVSTIRKLEGTKTSGIMKSEKENSELTIGIRDKEKMLEKELEDWKIKDWNSFFRENLPWWLKLNIKGLKKESRK